MNFVVQHTDSSSQARAGLLTTAHGHIETPIFMPVGTRAAVKGLTQADLKDIVKAQIVLANTYHLYLRPGIEIIENAGGIHKFMSWNRPVLTDSGGYQVYSLSSMRKINEEGASFSSHIDGSKHFFSPESIMDIQKGIGADIIMAFDECTPYPCDYSYARKSLGLTQRWLDRCYKRFNNSPFVHNYPQILVPIVQGSTYKDLRIESCKNITDKNAEINAIGGLSVGEPHHEMYEMTGVCTEILPKEKARYLMGVGLPENLLECISLGIDMFDCVLPSRNARHGILYTREGVIHIKNAKWKEDFSPIDPLGDASYSRDYSRAYLRHLFQVKEILASQIATAHNLRFYLWLVETAREKILTNKYDTWKNKMIPKLTFKL